ncbi:MAG: hypothetical protein RLZZ388_245 [Bacillota bacterium]
MAIVVKWLTHLTVNQACVGSSPIGRPNLPKKTASVFFNLKRKLSKVRVCYIVQDEKNETSTNAW